MRSRQYPWIDPMQSQSAHIVFPYIFSSRSRCITIISIHIQAAQYEHRSSDTRVSNVRDNDHVRHVNAGKDNRPGPQQRRCNIP